MNDRNRVLFLILIMIALVLTVGGVSIFMLYHTAFEEERARLTEMVKSQAHLMESITRFVRVNDKDYPGGIEKAVLDQVRQAHLLFSSYKLMGEFTISKMEGSNMVFLIRHNSTNTQAPLYIPFNTNLAEPMRQALMGKSGTLVGIDYRGEQVLAAFEPVHSLNMGVVAKIDIKDIQAPFIQAAFISFATALFMILLGVILFFRVTGPMLAHLSESEKNFRLLVENVKDYAIFMLDPGGRVTTWNEGALHIFGYGRREIIGRHFSCFFTNEDNEKNRPANDLLAASTEGHFEDEGWRIRKDGSKFWANVMISVIYGDKGRLIGYSKIMRDMTERKKSEEMLELLKYSIDTAYDGAYWMNTEGRFLYVNDAGCRALGYSCEELLKMSIFDINIQATPEIWAGLWKILREKKIFTAESVHKRKDGTLFPVEISSSYVKFGDQEYCNGFARDITDRKRSEDALKESEETLRVLLNSIPERAFLLDPAYNFIAVNQTVLNGLNKQTGDLIGKYALSFVPPQIAETRKKYFDQVNNTGQPVSFEDSNGGRDYINYISPIMDASGKIASIAVFAFDITERKRAEEALRESEERFRLTFDQSPIGAAIIDLDYRYVKANEELCHFLGYTEEELKMMTFRDTTHPDDLEDDMEMVKRLQKGEIEQYIKDKRYICKDGKTVWGHVSITIMKEPSGKPIYYLGMVENISERKTAEETIRESEARFRLTFDQSPIGAALSTLDYRFIRVNEELCRFLGYSAEEFKNLTFKDITHPEEVGRDAEQIRRLQAGEIEQYIIDKRYIRKDGKIVWGHLSISMLKDAAGKPIYFLPMIEDISERKRAQTALEESEELYRGLISAVPDIIVRTDINGLIIYTNEVVLQNWGGINTREFVGKNIFELIEPSEKEKAIENSRLMVEKSIGPREYKLVLSGDVKIDFEVNGDVLCGTDGKPYGFVYIVRDITERKLSEEKLHTSLKEKEALLRELYHRTKNNMQVIIALLQLHASKADSQTKSVFREMSDRIQSMALVHQKLYQSRNLASIDFREYISDLADLLMASYSIKEEKIKLILDVEKLLVQIDLAIPCGLILSELVSNSLKHAFPDERNGEIRISLHKTQNNIIELIVADNGVGVPDGFDFRNSVKMGIQSVYAVGEHQLRGEVQFESRGGVTCTLRFNEYDQDKA